MKPKPCWCVVDHDGEVADVQPTKRAAILSCKLYRSAYEVFRYIPAPKPKKRKRAKK